MFERFAKALKIAVRDEGFVQILGTGILLIIIGTITITYCTPTARLRIGASSTASTSPSRR
jgi:hypothetical protein